jgi:hypothetical protein
MITENDFKVEYVKSKTDEFYEYLEKNYFSYAENEKNRNHKSYAKDKLLLDIQRGRYDLGMINIWFRGKLARTFLLTKYKNWCLINRSITDFSVVNAHTMYLAIPTIKKVVISNKLYGVFVTFNKRKHHNLCFSGSLRKTRDSKDEPYLHYLFEKNYELTQMTTSLESLFLFNSVPQYVSYYSITGKKPDFLIPYEQ